MQTEAAREKSHAEPDVRFGDDPAFLSHIEAPGVALCIWRREPSKEMVQFLCTVAAGEPFVVETFDALDPLRFAALLRGHVWSEEPSCKAWAADLQSLLTLYCKLRPEPPSRPVHLKLGLVERIDCPVFHTDWVNLRLICTYVGAGTEYVGNRSVNRAALCRPLATAAQTNAAIVRDATAVRQVAPFAVGLFKGNTYPGQRGRGIVHRSPPTGTERRLKLIIDSAPPTREPSVSYPSSKAET